MNQRYYQANNINTFGLIERTYVLKGVGLHKKYVPIIKAIAQHR